MCEVFKGKGVEKRKGKDVRIKAWQTLPLMVQAEGEGAVERPRKEKDVSERGGNEQRPILEVEGKVHILMGVLIYLLSIE